jgi:hypothetical protein
LALSIRELHLLGEVDRGHDQFAQRRAESGLVHTAGVTTGKVHDAKVMDFLIREDDEAVYGDKAYASEAKKRRCGRRGRAQRARNRRFGRVRARVEDILRIVKCQFGYRKVRYRGIAKERRAGIRALGSRQSLPRPWPTLRPQREGGGFGAPRLSRRQANPNEKAVPVATDEAPRPCYSEAP